MNQLNQHQKLFLLIAIAGSICLAVLAYLALVPLDIASPDTKAASAESTKYSEWFDKITLVIYVALIFISNLIYRSTGKGINLFYGWLFFTVFTLISYVYLSNEQFHFRKETGLWEGESSLSFLGGIFLCGVAAIAAGINYLVLKKLVKK